MNYLLILGIALVIFGICFLISFIKEKTKRNTLVQGKVIQVIKNIGVSKKGLTYTPIFEYKYNNKTYKVEHRISSPTPDCTYKVNDIVDLRVYEDKPDKAIINSKNNLIAPLILGVSFIILGVVLLIVFVLF